MCQYGKALCHLHSSLVSPCVISVSNEFLVFTPCKLKYVLGIYRRARHTDIVTRRYPLSGSKEQSDEALACKGAYLTFPVERLVPLITLIDPFQIVLSLQVTRIVAWMPMLMADHVR